MVVHTSSHHHRWSQNRHNSFFVMVSDSSIPLYSPLVMYQQLADRHISAVDACTLATNRYAEHFDQAPHTHVAMHLAARCYWYTPPRLHAGRLFGGRSSAHPHIHASTHPAPRWPPTIGTDYFKQHHWRKTSQWFGLTRQHATLLGQETVIWSRYPSDCGACIADEHYWGSALAAYGQEDHTDCWGRLHYVNWDPGGLPRVDFFTCVFMCVCTGV